jgi:hypothetical protein
MSANPHPEPTRRLDRLQQLTLNTWRLATAKLDRVLEPDAILALAAVHVVLATLREVDRPMALFARHASADPELELVQSLVRGGRHAELDFDLLDAAFLRRWNELVADGGGPEELPPLRPRTQPEPDAPHDDAPL